MLVLVVEGDRSLGAFLEKCLRMTGQEAVLIADGDNVLAYATHLQPQLLVLDLDLPDGVAAALVTDILRACPDTAILALTSRDDASERAAYLNMGVDDCLVKPFSFDELYARCMAILRRRPSKEIELRYAGITINLLNRRASYGSHPLHLTKTEFQVLELLLRKRGDVCRRSELLRLIWNTHPETETNVVNVLMSGLRQKISAAQDEVYAPKASIIQTVRGSGYRLRDWEAPPSPIDLRQIKNADQLVSETVSPPVDMPVHRSLRKDLLFLMPQPDETAFSGRRVLLVGTDISLHKRLANRLTAARWRVQEASSGAEAMGYLDRQAYDAALVDHWLPDLEVSWFCQELTRTHPRMEILPMQGDGNLSSIHSPWRNELLHTLREAEYDGGQTFNDPAALLAVDNEEAHISTGHAVIPKPRQVVVFPPLASLREDPIEGMVGDSESMRKLRKLIRMVAPHQATVLIEGETGVGKELVAEALHRLSRRAEKPFVVVNCAAIPEQLLEAELFGHTRGAFTGAVSARTGRIEAAQGGTLFLDEIGELQLALQSKLLRFLENGDIQRVGDNQTKHVDVRVIAATHQHLESKAKEGTFRLDLYHRLAVFPIHVPPLRERKEDIPELAKHFLTRMKSAGLSHRISADAMRLLMGHSWPGNVRELSHMLERSAILAEADTEIGEEHIHLIGRSDA